MAPRDGRVEWQIVSSRFAPVRNARAPLMGNVGGFCIFFVTQSLLRV